MSGFVGTYTYAIDHKGRLGIPAPLRRATNGQSYMLVMGFEGCLALYTEEGWQRVEERLQQLPLGRRKARKFQRQLYKDATRVTVDTQGRITIPPALITRAGLGKEAVLLGQGHKLEIWNPDRLNSEITEGEGEESYESLAEDVLG